MNHWRQGTNGDAQSEVRGLPDHHPQSIPPHADFGPLGLGVDQRGVARGPVSAAERRSPHRRVALFAVRGRSGHRSANGPGVVSRRHRPAVEDSPPMGSIVGRDVRVPHAAAVDTQSCEADSRLCATLLVGKIVSDSAAAAADTGTSDYDSIR